MCLRQYLTLVHTRQVNKLVPIRTGSDDPEDSTGIVEVVFQHPNSYYDDPHSIPDELGTAREHSSSIHSVPIGVFTTAYARIELYRLLDTLGDRVMYCDTDSVIYRYDPTATDENKQHLLPTGPFLGQLKDECAGKEILEFFSGGPKNYGFITSDGKSKSTVKGLPRLAIRPEFQAAFIRASTLAGTSDESKDRIPDPQRIGFARITRDRMAQQVRTDVNAFRSYRLVNDKVHLFRDGSTLPFGHADIAKREAQLELDRDLWNQRLLVALDECVEERKKQNKHQGLDEEPALPQPQSQALPPLPPRRELGNLRQRRLVAEPIERDGKDEKDARVQHRVRLDNNGDDDRVVVQVGHRGRVQRWNRDRAEAALHRLRRHAREERDAEDDDMFEREQLESEWMGDE